MSESESQEILLVMVTACFQGTADLLAMAHRVHSSQRFLAVQYATILGGAEDRRVAALQLLRSTTA